MRKHSAEECAKSRRALIDTLEVINGKWKLPILQALDFNTFRFKELTREVGITPRMLSRELKAMEVNKLIKRKVVNTYPVTIEYSITPYGTTLRTVISAMREWGLNHRKMIIS